jgi:hypothetical protein
VSSVKEIPRDNYKTWSLFLVCDEKWLGSGNDSAPGLYSLYLDFEKFGKAIGDDNLAVWFWKQNQTVDSKLASNIDVPRSAQFCKAYNLDPSKGPYLVISSTYPDESHLPSGLPPNSALFSLGNMKPNQVSPILEQVSAQLVQKRALSANRAATSDANGGAQPKPSVTWGVSLLESVQQVLTRFGCAWDFKIDAGPVQADLHPCGTG